MDIQNLLTNFDGRIPRSKFWLGILCLVILSIALIFVLGAILPIAWASLIGTLVVLYPAAAIYTKRLHDRNKPMSPWLWIFLVPSLLYSVMSAFGIGFAEVILPGQPPAMMPIGVLGWGVSLAVMVVGIWAVVELGILKGTEGDNDHGPDPLA